LDTFSITAKIRLFVDCKAKVLPSFIDSVSISFLKLRFTKFEIAYDGIGMAGHETISMKSKSTFAALAKALEGE